MKIRSMFSNTAFVAADGPLSARVELRPGQLFKVAGSGRSLRVISGTAWVSDDAVDHIVARGDRLGLKALAGPALVSDLSGTGLVLEVL